jgi:hypothetical protein
MSFLFRDSARGEAGLRSDSSASGNKGYGNHGAVHVTIGRCATRLKRSVVHPIAICAAVSVAVIASIGSLDMEGPTSSASGVGPVEAATLTPDAPVGPIRIHGTSSEADGSMTLTISFAMTWDGGVSFGNPAGPPDIPVVEATITALSPKGEPTGTGYRAITMMQSDPLVVESIRLVQPPIPVARRTSI